MTTEYSCESLQRWFSAADASAIPDAALVAHIVGCSRCRGELALRAAQFVVPPPAHPLDCAEVAADLPAYSELAHTQGERVAAQHYPALWWHLWMCPDCAEVAADVAVLLEAEAAGELALPAFLSAPPTRVIAPAPAPIRLSRAFLNAVFAPQRSLGVTWSSETEQIFLTEEVLPDCRLSIFVREESATHWCLEVTVEPPVRGDLIVQLAGLRFRAPLVPGKPVRLGGIPSYLLTTETGPDLLITLAQEVG